jgi:hypothetical protein
MSQLGSLTEVGPILADQPKFKLLQLCDVSVFESRSLDRSLREFLLAGIPG